MSYIRKHKDSIIRNAEMVFISVSTIFLTVGLPFATIIFAAQ